MVFGLKEKKKEHGVTTPVRLLRCFQDLRTNHVQYLEFMCVHYILYNTYGKWYYNKTIACT